MIVPLIGPASLLESWDRPTWWTLPWMARRLEALVGTVRPDGHLDIHHYFRGQRRPDSGWLRGDLISSAAVGPGTLSQRGRGRRHELVALIPEAEGLVRYTWEVNAPLIGRWRRDGVVPGPGPDPVPSIEVPVGPDEWGDGEVIAVSVAQTKLRRNWTQALVQVDSSLYQLHRQVRRQGSRWFRAACLRLADDSPFVADEQPSRKLAQISGEHDSQPSADGSVRRTLSRSESRSGVRGTDLGVRVEHEGRSFLLFGDTHWQASSRGTRDAIAEVHDPGDGSLPRVEFHGSPLKIVGGGTTMREYDVPLDAFSIGEDFYVFFTSNHFRDSQVMGRSVLTRAVDPSLPVSGAARHSPLRFRFIDTFSDDRFINVSVQRVGDQLLLWGAGAYRADSLRLATLDLSTPGLAADLCAGSGAVFRRSLRYWAGLDGHGDPVWSSAEAAARPLLTPGANGEVSVRFVPECGRYLMLAMSGPEDPIGPAVVLRTAKDPWGPWSPRRRLLDWIAIGMSFGNPVDRFIRSAADGTDPVGDTMFRGQATATGAAYAPYFFDARRDDNVLLLRYTLSTWNPYQVVLMQHRLAVGDLT